MRVVRGLAVILSGSLLGLFACAGGGDGPVVLPTGTTQPSATPTPTASTAVLPSTSEPTPTTTLVLGATEVSEADAFVRQFFEAYNAAQDSGEFAAFDAMYLPQCGVCIQMRNEVEAWLADDGTVVGADWVLQQISSVSIVDNAGTTALAYRTLGTVRSGGATSAVPMLPIQIFNLNVRRADPWIIQDLGFGDAS